jgi:cytochrome c oxidase cbb3-type subunit II
MKSGFTVFLAAFIALGFSWCGFVLAPVLQLGAQKQTTVLNSSDVYPNQRPGNATLGLQVYRAYGCAACHTTQIGQDGVVCDVVLAGKTNPPAATELFAQLKSKGLSKEEADVVANQISAKGGKTETHIVPTGADIARGWGMRHSVAEDFLWDNPVQIGSVRVGPDLANVGLRYNADWEYKHLCDPKSVVNNSAMPPFTFLFQKQGDTMVPTEDAKNLVAYLLSLRADVALHDAPFTAATPASDTKK